MRAFFHAVLVAAAVVALGQPSATAQTAKFRHLTSAYADSAGSPMRLPEGVACGPSGQIVVGDTGNDRLLLFSYADKTMSGGSEIRIPQLTAPSRVRLNSAGDIYALDSKARRVVHLTASGEFVEAVAFAGAPPPATMVLKAFTLDAAGNVYAIDVFSSRVLVADAAGQFTRALPFPSGIGFASDVAIDEAGAVLLLDSINRRLFAAARDASAFVQVGGDLTDIVSTMPTFMTVSQNTIFIAEGSGGRIVSLRRDGTFMARQLTEGREEGSLAQPAQFCINDRDEVFVADRDNSRIQVFQLLR